MPITVQLANVKNKQKMLMSWNMQEANEESSACEAAVITNNKSCFIIHNQQAHGY